MTRFWPLLAAGWHEPPVFPADWGWSKQFSELRQRARRLIEADFGAAEPWGWKDPRNCLTLPFWQHILPPTHHVICLRSPIDVALSLSQRENFPLKKCVDLWLRYMHDALKHTSGKPRLLIFYEDLMANWPAELRRLAAFLGRPETADQADVQSAVKDFVDEDLRHYHATLIDAVDNADLGFPAKAMYVLLRACVNAAPNERDTFGEAADRVQQVLDSFSGYSLEAEESAGRLMELAAKLEEEKSQACRELQSFVTQLADSKNELRRLEGQLSAEQEGRAKEIADREQTFQDLRAQLSLRENEAHELQTQLQNERERGAGERAEQNAVALELQTQLAERERVLQDLRTMHDALARQRLESEELLRRLRAESGERESALQAQLESERVRWEQQLAQERDAASRALATVQAVVPTPLPDTAACTIVCKRDLHLRAPLRNHSLDTTPVCPFTCCWPTASTDTSSQLRRDFGCCSSTTSAFPKATSYRSSTLRLGFKRRSSPFCCATCSRRIASKKSFISTPRFGFWTTWSPFSTGSISAPWCSRPTSRRRPKRREQAYRTRLAPFIIRDS